MLLEHAHNRVREHNSSWLVVAPVCSYLDLFKGCNTNLVLVITGQERLGGDPMTPSNAEDYTNSIIL